MVKRTGPTNPYLKQLIELLRKKYLELNKPIWKDCAEKLSKPTRKRVEVNLNKIERYAKNGETILVPGVVLSTGRLTKKIIVAAWRFSPKAKEKIEKCGGEVVSIDELIEKNPKGTGVRLMV